MRTVLQSGEHYSDTTALGPPQSIMDGHFFQFIRAASAGSPPRPLNPVIGPNPGWIFASGRDAVKKDGDCS
jgi:hypothetical protein